MFALLLGQLWATGKQSTCGFYGGVKYVHSYHFILFLPEYDNSGWVGKDQYIVSLLNSNVVV